MKLKKSQKTKLLIKKIFAEMIYEKQSIHKITVSELTKRASIDRSTFYLHYDDIYMVAYEFEQDIYNEVIDKLPVNPNLSIEYYFDFIADYLKKKEEIYKLLIQDQDSLYFLNQIRDKFIILINELSKIRCINLDMNIITCLLDGIMLSVVRYLKGEIKDDIETIKKSLYKLFNLYISSETNQSLKHL